MTNNPQTERLGIGKLEILFAEIGWHFREQFVKDIGIDAQVEVVANNVSTGELIALQVKSGESYFNEIDGNHVVYRVDKKHYYYWSKHSLPVIIILYNPKTDDLLWCPVIDDGWEELENSFKIKINRDQKLTVESSSTLRKVIKLPLHSYRLNKLNLDHSLMQQISEDREVFVEYDDWVNKSLSRTEIRIYIQNGSDWDEQKIQTTYCAGLTSYQILEKLLPWADFVADIETYDSSDEATDEEWYEEPDNLKPIYSDGEIETYRLKVTLNDLGKAFLTVADYLYDSNNFEMRSFTIDGL